MGKGFMEFTCHLYRFFISLSSMAVFFLHTTERGSLKSARKVRERAAAPVFTQFHCPQLALFARPAKTAMLSRLVFHPKLCTPTQNITLKQQQQKRNLIALQLG